MQRRVISEAVKGGVPTVESSQYKLFMNECSKRTANAALDLRKLGKPSIVASEPLKIEVGLPNLCERAGD